MSAPQEKPTAKSRIFLVEDHRSVLHGYRLMLDAEPDLTVCGAATTAAEAISAVEQLQPDLVITDLTLPGRSGLDLVKDLIAIEPTRRILVCSMHDEALYAQRALRAGAKGYIMKDADGPTYLAAIRAVLNGQSYVSEKLAAQVLDAFGAPQSRGSNSPLEKLSDRELEIFRLFGAGKTAKEIARQLNISPKTVSVHRDHVKEKLNFATSAEMIRQAVRYVETEQFRG